MNDLNRQFLILTLYLLLTTTIGASLISASKVTIMQYFLCGLGFVFFTPLCKFIVEVAKDCISLIQESIDDRRK